MYSRELLDYFQNPRNAGEVPHPNASAMLENPVCGDVLKLTLKVEDGTIVDVRFKARGCVPAMACGSAVTEMVKDKGVLEARDITADDLARCLNGLPEASSHASQLAIDTLRAALQMLP